MNVAGGHTEAGGKADTVPGTLLSMLPNARVRVKLDDGREVIASLPLRKIARLGFWHFVEGQRADVLLCPPSKLHKIVTVPTLPKA